MSQLLATITSIESMESLNIVTFVCAGQKLQMVSLELNETVQKGKNVTLACKPTTVALAKPIIPGMNTEDFCSILSYANQLRVKIISLDIGQLLCSALLSLGEFTLEAILSRDAVERLQLCEGDEVIALIKANELSILEVLDD